MNPVVVDIQGKYACILTEDGEFLKIRNKNYQIGQRIEMKEEFSPKFFSLKYLATALALVLVVATSGGVYAYPYGTVSLDVNPSITYTINIFDRVIGVEGLNDDGEKLVDDLSSVKNMKIEEAISTTIEELQSSEYLQEEENLVVVSVITKNEEHSAKVVTSVEAKKANDDSVEVIATVPTKEILEIAAELNTSPGKVWLAEKAISVLEDETIEVADLVKEPVKEIVNKAKKAQSIIEDIRFGSDDKTAKKEEKQEEKEQEKTQKDEIKEAEEKFKNELKKEIKKEIKKELEKETGEKIEDSEVVEKIVEIIKDNESEELEEIHDALKKALPEELQDLDLKDIDPKNIDLNKLSSEEIKNIGLQGYEWWSKNKDKINFKK